MNDSHWDAGPFLKRALDVVPGIIYVFNQQTQSNEYSNQSLGNLLGYSVQEIQDMGDAMFPTLCHPDDLPKIGAHFEKMQGISDDAVISIEYRMLHKNGDWVWLLSQDAIYERDAAGGVLRHIGAATNITPQKDHEAVAAAVQSELLMIFNAATSGIIALDDEGRILRVNNRARHMLGGISTPTPFKWPEKIEFLDGETLKPLEASADPVRRAMSGNQLNGETHLMRRTQHGEDRRYVRIQSATVESAASHAHTVLVIDDVSNEERNRQVVERKSRLDALGQLTGGIAHDFNNLLAAQLYAVDLARKAGSPEEREEYLEVAADAIERGRSLTSRLLAFARRQPGLASVREADAVFDDFERLVRPMLEESIAFDVMVEDPSLRVYCDHTQLETALMNLVLNSRDAILRGGKGSRIRLQARAVRSPTNTLDDQQDQNTSDEPIREGESFRYVEILVSDNGPGMNPETLARCTDPFFTTKDTNSGTGLGLAMVYGFVRQANGDLRIYSDEGIGTTVQLTMPRGTIAGAREEPMPEDSAIEGKGETIFLVEDEEMIVRMLTRVLQDLGYEVITAESGKAALEMIAKGVTFDLLLTDVVMPGKIGGFELARRVRKTHPTMPIIYTSGYTGFTASEMGEVQAPMLQKPSPPAELAAAISDALKT